MLRLDKHLRASSVHLLWHLSPAHSIPKVSATVCSLFSSLRGISLLG